MHQQTMKKIRAIVSGKVQGVGYRMFTLQKARQIGVNGYVRNLANGNVEIVASGEVKRVDTLLKWTKSGPPGAIVKNLEIELLDSNAADFQNFEIRK